MTTTPSDERTVYEDADGAPYPESVQTLGAAMKEVLFEAVGLDGRREDDQQQADELVVMLLEKVMPVIDDQRQKAARQLLESLLQSAVLEPTWAVGGPADAVWVMANKGRSPHVDVSDIMSKDQRDEAVNRRG